RGHRRAGRPTATPGAVEGARRRAPAVAGRRAAAVSAAGSKPRIALVVDSPGWAFDNIAQRVATHLADEFSFEAHYQADYGWPDAYRIVPETLGAGYDLVHFFWRLAPVHMLLDPVFLPSLLEQEPLDELVDRYLAQPVTISVHDHLFLGPE